MASLIGRHFLSYSICVLLKMCLFSKNILLGDGKNSEAIFNIRSEATSTKATKYFIYADIYPLFQDLFFNKTITAILLHYTCNEQDRYICDNVYFYEEPQYNGTYFSCQNMANNSVIQCLKIPGSSDSLSEKCSNGTNIQWSYEDEYLRSSYLQDKNIKEEKNLRLNCYTLVTNHTFQPDTTISTALNTYSGSSLAAVTITSKDSSALSSGVIAGIIIGIVIAIIAIIIVLLILRRRKHKKDLKKTSISHIQLTSTRSAYNQQTLEKIGVNSIANAHFTSSKYADDPYMEISNDKSKKKNCDTETEPDYVAIDKDYSILRDTTLSATIVASKDEYTYIEDIAENEQASSVDDGYTTLDQTKAGFDESVAQQKEKSHTGVPNYNNVEVVIADDNEKVGRKKDVYSKLGDKARTFQNDYGDFNEDSQNEEIKGAEGNSENVNRSKEKERRKDVYSKLRENNVNFQNTYGEVDLDLDSNIGEEENDHEVSNTYFELEKDNPNVYTINT